MANSFFTELKRRNVFRVMAAYIVMSWLILQVIDLLADILNLPNVFAQGILILLIIGFIIATVISWIYQYTPDGLVKETPDGEETEEVREISHKLNYATIIMVIVGVLFVTFENVIFERPAQTTVTEEPSEPSPETKPEQEVNNRSIAVLPFVNMSSEKEDEYFADGLSEEILNQLAQIVDLKVTGRTSSFSYKGKNIDLRTIGETLGVANILEGSVRRNGDMVRVTAQLIRAEDGFHLWSHTYDNTLEDIFAVQDDISENVARALQIILDEDAIEKMHNAGIRNVDAFVAYQKANELFNLAHGLAPLIPTLREGTEYYNKAIEIVPEFATAHMDVTDYYAHLMLHSDESLEVKLDALEKTKYHYAQAYKYTPNLNQKNDIRFDQIIFSDDWSTLAQQIEIIASNDDCSLPIWIEMLNPFGYADKVQNIWNTASICDPLSISYPIQLAGTYMWLGKPEESLKTIVEAEKKRGSNPWFSSYKQNFLISLDRPKEALALAPFVVRDTAFGALGYVTPYAYMGESDRAREELEKWSSRNYAFPGVRLVSYAMIGDREEANTIAAELDTLPGGILQLLVYTNACMCGAPFDIEVTPNLQQRLTEAGFAWPPKTLIQYPNKTW